VLQGEPISRHLGKSSKPPAHLVLRRLWTLEGDGEAIKGEGPMSDGRLPHLLGGQDDHHGPIVRGSQPEGRVPPFHLQGTTDGVPWAGGRRRDEGEREVLDTSIVTGERHEALDGLRVRGWEEFALG
jgi:hypothetical protein